MPAAQTARRVVRETVSGLPREFWWLWTSTLINRLGGFVVTFLALYLTVDRGFSASYAGLVAALYGLGGSAGAVAGGVLSDRVGRRATLLIAQTGTAVTTAVLGFVTAPVAIAVVAAALGVVSNASRPAGQAMGRREPSATGRCCAAGVRRRPRPAWSGLRGIRGIRGN